jgi:ABC-2 type transport system ATP-binding protein
VRSNVEGRGSNAEPLIELAGLRKVFGKRVAVDALDLAVGRGEIFGVLGHNGAGKSTAIGMMLGQVWPTAGEVRVCGCDVTRDRAGALRKVGAIFEAPVFYDYLSGWRNLEILAHYTSVTPESRLREVIDWVGLTGREQSKVRTYSHGMRARLALAQALLPNPELLILDEPSDGLDPEGIHEMRHTILRLNRALGLTIFLSSHLLNEVEQLCTRIAVLRQGHKIFEGRVEEAKASGNWLRLRVNDFEAAMQMLTQSQLIISTRDSRLVSLSDGVEAPQIAEALVCGGFRIHELAPEEQTLEAFYLSLSERK